MIKNRYKTSPGTYFCKAKLLSTIRIKDICNQTVMFLYKHKPSNQAINRTITSLNFALKIFDHIFFTFTTGGGNYSYSR